MSMPSLLSHFGIDRARYITSDGQVIFDGVTATAASTFTHPLHGTVTPVTRHTFHGGDEPGDTAPTEDDPADHLWWHDPQQVERHATAVRTAFPQFKMTPATTDHPPTWTGHINTGRGRFGVTIVLRQDNGLPIIVPNPRLRLGVHEGRHWHPSPHLFTNGHLCVADQDDWDPDQHTAATAIAWTAHWFAAYTEWRFRRRWPVDGAHPRAS